MSDPTYLITELTRAANELDELSIDERRDLLRRALGVVREMHLISASSRRIGPNSEAERALNIAALMAEAAANNDDLQGVLLALAEIDPGAEDWLRKQRRRRRTATTHWPPTPRDSEGRQEKSVPAGTESLTLDIEVRPFAITAMGKSVK